MRDVVVGDQVQRPVALWVSRSIFFSSFRHPVPVGTSVERETIGFLTHCPFGSGNAARRRLRAYPAGDKAAVGDLERQLRDWLGRSFGGFVDQMEDCFRRMAKPSQSGFKLAAGNRPLTWFPGRVPPHENQDGPLLAGKRPQKATTNVWSTQKAGRRP